MTVGGWPKSPVLQDDVGAGAAVSRRKAITEASLSREDQGP